MLSEQAQTIFRKYLTREPYRLPQIRIMGRGSLEELDAEIYGYDHHPAIKVDVIA
jgi:thymidylate synthase